ncbi:MAG: non-ribosomal peptide synthetase, partial [Actinobacteria bacterium]
RTAAMVVAVLKAGAAYVPLDPTYPPARLAVMVSDAAPVALLGPPGLVNGVPALPVDLGDLRLAVHAGPVVEATVPTGGSDLAYVLYTSGSTGTPKGVGVEHRQVLNYLAGIDAVAGLPAGRYAMVQPLAVDSSAVMLHGALYHGGTLVTVPRS